MLELEKDWQERLLKQEKQKKILQQEWQWTQKFNDMKKIISNTKITADQPAA